MLAQYILRETLRSPLLLLLLLLVLVSVMNTLDLTNLQNRSPIYVAKTLDGKFCSIPFMFKGITYHDCIQEGDHKSWCSLEREFVTGSPHWGYCAPHPKEFQGCKRGTPNITAQEVDEILSEHNKFRALQPAIKMRKMEWNSELAQKAQAAADRCYHDHIESILCGDRYETGQNLYYNYWDKGYPDQISWTQVINFWSREGKDYNIETMECTPDKICGHYTQVVWDNSGQIGCGKSYCHGPMYGDKTNVQYSIQYFCNYFLSGNYNGRRPYTVSNDERCQECYLYDPDRKFRCTKDKLCEACQNDNVGCQSLDEVKMLAAQGKICTDTGPSCAENIHVCGLEKSGAWLPPPVLDFINNCNKTCNRC